MGKHKRGKQKGFGTKGQGIHWGLTTRQKPYSDDQRKSHPNYSNLDSRRVWVRMSETTACHIIPGSNKK